MRGRRGATEGESGVHAGLREGSDRPAHARGGWLARAVCYCVDFVDCARRTLLLCKNGTETKKCGAWFLLLRQNKQRVLVSSTRVPDKNKGEYLFT